MVKLKIKNVVYYIICVIKMRSGIQIQSISFSICNSECKNSAFMSIVHFEM